MWNKKIYTEDFGSIFNTLYECKVSTVYMLLYYNNIL